MDNYVPYHVHTDLSNCVTSIDSVTNYKSYVQRASELGMKAFGFSEHGSVLSWLHKKEEIEGAGMKYIHAEEFYLTASLSEKIRDNYHVVLIAKNLDGFKELNTLSSKAFNREDGHFYFVPRITFEELQNTSDNILITTACVASPLCKGEGEIRDRYIEFLASNPSRVFLEVQHHKDKKQIEYNQYLLALSERHKLPIIAGTDTHALNPTHVEGRTILQKANNIFFEGEKDWDLTFKSLSELIEAYKTQGALTERDYMRAIDNTNYMASLIEPFEVDRAPKYPKLYENNAEYAFKKAIREGVDKLHLKEKPNWDEYKNRINYEYETYRHNGAIDYMLLEHTYKTDLKNDGVLCGYSRGSVSGSIIAYILGITEVDSIEHGLNFERFMNTERISLADIDSDWADEDRDKVKEWLYSRNGLYCSNIITYGTLDLKGAIKDVARALDISPKESNDITKIVETKEYELRQKYPELFKYVDIIRGTIKTMGIHACGTVVSPFPLEDSIGLCSSKSDEHPVSQLNMKELDSMNFVKLDVLGLDTIDLINKTCKMVGIPRLNPNNTPSEEKVWRDIVDDTTCIFQWESDMATSFLRQLFSKDTLERIKKQNPDVSYIDLLSIGNGAIRPAGASYRDMLANGVYKDNGNIEINEFLKSTLGQMVFQEQIMGFLNKFCGYSMGESDGVRRAIGKKTGTEVLLPEIKDRFVKEMTENHNLSENEAETLIGDFLQVILDASDYAFSLNHSDPYSWTGYICGYLRYHYPLEFLTTAFNIYATKKKDEDKTAKITQYASRHGIGVMPIKFRKSGTEYTMDKETNAIYRGVGSIKGMSETASEYLYSLKDKKYDTFVDLLMDIPKSEVNSGQMLALINLDFFSEFGNINTLLDIYKIFSEKLKSGEAKSIACEEVEELVGEDWEYQKTAQCTLKKRQEIKDMGWLLHKVEDRIRARNYPAPPFEYLVDQQEKYMGFVDVVTGRKEDRNTLYIKEVVPLVNKNTNQTWAYAFHVQSIGTGKMARLTVRRYTYDKMPVYKGGLIKVDPYSVKKNRAGFWDLLSYQKARIS